MVERTEGRNKFQYTHIGCIEIKDGQKVFIGDPCYDLESYGTFLEDRFKAGYYECFVKKEEKNGGEYFANESMLFVNSDWITAGTEDEMIKKAIQFIDEDVPNNVDELFSESIYPLGVDAGVIGISVDKPDFNQRKWLELCRNQFADINKKNAFVYSYDLNKHASNEFDSFCCSVNDGVYAGSLIYEGYDSFFLDESALSNKKIIGVEIRFGR